MMSALKVAPDEVSDEDEEEEDCTNFVTHGKACDSWIAVDIPVILHQSK